MSEKHHGETSQVSTFVIWTYIVVNYREDPRAVRIRAQPVAQLLHN